MSKANRSTGTVARMPYVIIAGVQGVLVLTAATALVVGLYLLKSALGVNLMVGPSVLHDLLYPLVR